MFSGEGVWASVAAAHPQTRAKKQAVIDKKRFMVLILSRRERRVEIIQRT
jgi:hypothetical protein